MMLQFGVDPWSIGSAAGNGCWPEDPSDWAPTVLLWITTKGPLALNRAKAELQEQLDDSLSSSAVRLTKRRGKGSLSTFNCRSSRRYR